jgi:hypothetical protein
MTRSTTFRIIGDLTLFLSVFFAPPLFVFLAICVGMIVIDAYYESIVIALMIDILYGVPVEAFAGYGYIYTSAAVVVFWAVAIVKPYMRA